MQGRQQGRRVLKPGQRRGGGFWRATALPLHRAVHAQADGGLVGGNAQANRVPAAVGKVGARHQSPPLLPAFQAQAQSPRLGETEAEQVVGLTDLSKELTGGETSSKGEPDEGSGR